MDLAEVEEHVKSCRKMVVTGKEEEEEEEGEGEMKKKEEEKKEEGGEIHNFLDCMYLHNHVCCNHNCVDCRAAAHNRPHPQPHPLTLLTAPAT